MSNMALFIALGITGQQMVSRGMRDVSRDSSRAAREVSAAWTNASRHLSTVGSALGTAAAMVGGTALLRQVIMDVAEFERGLLEAGLTGDMSAEGIAKVRKSIMDLSSETLQLPEDQLAAFKDMVAAGIDPQKAIAGMRDISRTATASFSQVTDIAATATDLIEKMNIAPEKMGRAFNIMLAGAKEGKFELKDMARYFPEVTSDAARFGIVNERGVAQMTAMLEIARKGTAIPSEAANNMRNFFASITSYRQAFRKLGINIFEFIDPKTGKFKAGKDVDAFMREIIKKSGGSGTRLELAGIRDRQAKDFILLMMQHWKEYERIRDKALGSADKDVIGKDFAVVEQSTYGDIQRAKIGQSQAMKSPAAAETASKGMGLINWGIEHPLLTAGGAALGYAGYRVLRGRIGKKLGGGLPGAGSGGAGGMGQPIPVYVVNKHLSMLPGQGWGFPGEAPGAPPGKPKGPSRFSKTWLRALGGLAMGAPLEVVGTGMAAYQAGSWLEKRFIKGRIGEWAYDKLHPQQAPAGPVKNDVAIEIHFDELLRPFVRTPGMNTNARVNAPNRGTFDALLGY
jgi:TP901 family phage tail tape measure protein